MAEASPGNKRKAMEADESSSLVDECEQPQHKKPKRLVVREELRIALENDLPHDLLHVVMDYWQPHASDYHEAFMKQLLSDCVSHLIRCTCKDKCILAANLSHWSRLCTRDSIGAADRINLTSTYELATNAEVPINLMPIWR